MPKTNYLDLKLNSTAQRLHQELTDFSIVGSLAAKTKGLCEQTKKVNIRCADELPKKQSEWDKVFNNQLSTRDIIEYAILRMENGDDDETLVELACEYDTNAEEVERLVKLLACKENTKYDIEFRKWRVLYVAKKLPSNDAEYINGLMELGDICVELDFPEDSPHIFQGRENDMTQNSSIQKKIMRNHFKITEIG